MTDHDQRFKTLLKELLPEFFELFFADWAERFDFSSVEWLDKEVFPDPPEGQRRVLDLVAKLRTREPLPAQEDLSADEWLSLIHVEIESADNLTSLRRRMHWYYANLRQRHELPVLPIGLYLRVGLQGLGTDRYEEFYGPLRLLIFEYPYVGLPALDGIEYLERGTSLGLALAAMMRLPPGRRAWFKAEALLHVKDVRQNEQLRFLLAECIQTYLPLDRPEEQAEFEQLLNSGTYEEVKRMATTWFEQGIEQGIEQGQRATLVAQVEERFGPLRPEVQKRLDEWPAHELTELARRLVRAHSLEELGLARPVA